MPWSQIWLLGQSLLAWQPFSGELSGVVFSEVVGSSGWLSLVSSGCWVSWDSGSNSGEMASSGKEVSSGDAASSGEAASSLGAPSSGEVFSMGLTSLLLSMGWPSAKQKASGLACFSGGTHKPPAQTKPVAQGQGRQLLDAVETTQPWEDNDKPKGKKRTQKAKKKKAEKMLRFFLIGVSRLASKREKPHVYPFGVFALVFMEAQHVFLCFWVERVSSWGAGWGEGEG